MNKQGLSHLDDLPVFDQEKHEKTRIMNCELCKCLTKTPEWKHHKQYCPVWKNGRIAELEAVLVRFKDGAGIESLQDLGIDDSKYKKNY